jgi:ADP-heptose:LPS heptosyltransferase
MKFLVINFNNGFGNTVLLNSSLKFIKDKLKNVEITILSNNRDNDLDISKINLDISKTIDFNKISIKEKFHLIKNIFFGDYEYIFFPPFSVVNIFYFSLIFIFGRSIILIPVYYKKLNTSLRSIVLIFLRFFRKIFNSKAVLYSDVIDINCHEIDANLNLVKKIFSQAENIDKKYSFNSINLNLDEEYLKNYGLHKDSYICIQYGTSHGSLTPKVWSHEKLINLITNLSKDFQLVILGSAKDRSPLSILETQTNVKNLIGKTSMYELATLLKFSQSNICFDSGIMHLCDAMQVKSINIIGPSNLEKVKPRNKLSYIIHEKVDCSPCLIGWYFDPKSITELQAYNKCQEKFKCMELISTEKVINLVKSNYEKN